MKRIAIIDLGSNTARLVALRYTPGRTFRLLDELREVVRLSEGMTGTNELRPEAMERGLQALRSFRTYCDAAGIHDIVATATSAVRDARNGPAFLDAARHGAGIDLEILAGEDEARYGALAAANSLAIDDAHVLDIGGGSAQLSHLEGRRFTNGRSFPLGAVRLTEMFLTSDPPKRREIKALVQHVRKTVGTPERTPVLVGMGGTVRNLADVQHKRESYPADLLHGYTLGADALRTITDDLLAKTTAQRRAVPGLNSDRADIIVAGALVAREIVDLTGAPGILISGQGLREGLFYDRFLGPTGGLMPDVRAFSIGNLTARYYDHPEHNEHVRHLALELFDGLADLHGYGRAERELLAHAALAHDIGMAVDYFDHHKHGYYLMMSSALPGFTHREQAILALLVRYHRKGKPDPQGVGGLLEPGDMERVTRLAALVRLAEYLERSKAQRVRSVRCRIENGAVHIDAIADGDISVEVLEANRRSDLLANAYGVSVQVAAVA